MTSPFEVFRHWWEHDRQRPFLRLVELFVERIFRGGGDADAEGLDFGIGLVLTLLALPGGFVSILLLDKYASFLQWLRGMTNVDPLATSFPDEYFFIVLSMTVTGAAAVWRWDAVFPDRRDYLNLVPLPIPMRTIFLANLLAVVFLAGLVAIDVNAASCVLFPMVVGATQTQFFFFLRFAGVHAMGVMLASVFAFFAVFSVLGILMALLPPRFFKRASAYVRGVIVMYLATLLCTSFAVPYNLWKAKNTAPSWALLLPSSWFLSLCQSTREPTAPALLALSKLSLPAVALVVVIAITTYAIGYHRHFVRIPELAETADFLHFPRRSRAGLFLHDLLLRTPFQRGCFPFVWKTLFRSETHRLMLTGVSGLALVLASQAMMNAFQTASSWRQAAVTPEALSIPFILTFLLILGLRIVFEIPIELRSNWIFQLVLDRNRQECEKLARNVILAFTLPLTAVLTFPGYAYLEGLQIALLHTLVTGTWVVLLTNVALIRFRKLPFTCTLPLFKQHSIVLVLSCCFGYLIYALSIPEYEASVLAEPLRLLGLVPPAVVAWFVPQVLTKSTPEIERKLIFEDSVTRTFELLRLGE
jgi:hypothetical protein